MLIVVEIKHSNNTVIRNTTNINCTVLYYMYIKIYLQQIVK